MEDNNKNSKANNDEEEDVREYMRVNEIFSFENFARMHREIEQLKDVIREIRSVQ
jgi:uncharacterized protein YgfB (UPF0149 family)